MSIFEPSLSPWTGRMLSIFRIIAGLIFLTAGTTILFGYPPSPMPMPKFPLMSQMGVGAILEIVGGLAIVFGLLTRPIPDVRRPGRVEHRRHDRPLETWTGSR